jgi:hypothetical protein
MGYALLHPSYRFIVIAHFDLCDDRRGDLLVALVHITINVVMSIRMNISDEISRNLGSHGFKRVIFDDSRFNDFKLILKRQTWNTNRAVCVLKKNSMPSNFDLYIKEMRKLAAFKVKFFPFFYGVGIQMIVICPGIIESIGEPKDYVSNVDNQWAIVQSLFLIDDETKIFKEARTWGQFVTGKFQDIISETIAIS